MDSAPGVEVRAQFSVHNVVVTERAPDIEAARQIAAKWKHTFLTMRGCHGQPAPRLTEITS